MLCRTRWEISFKAVKSHSNNILFYSDKLYQKRIYAIKNGQELPCKKPDIDNVIKIILDALNGIAYKDDCQVVEVIAVKKYTEETERVELEFEELI